MIEKTLSCSVCGLVSDVYENKVRHESKCLKRYLAVIGNSTEGKHRLYFNKKIYVLIIFNKTLKSNPYLSLLITLF